MAKVDWRAKLDEVNSIIFSEGAPLGSDNYWKIREIASEASRSIAIDRRSNVSVAKNC